MSKWIGNLTARRGIALALGPGFVLLGVDAAIGHLAGKSMESPLQLVPVIYAPVAALVVLAAAVPRWKEALFGGAMKLLGGTAVLVGLVGTVLHLKWLLSRVERPLGWEALEGLLAVAPPLFAPLSYAGVGLLLWALGSRRLAIGFRREPSAAPLTSVAPLPADRADGTESGAGGG